MEDNKLVKVQVWDPEADDEEEIDILELFGYYMSKLPLLIATVVIGVLMVGFYTVYHQAPGVDLYTAKSKMVVFFAPGDSAVDLSDINVDILNMGRWLSKDCVELIKSRAVVEDVIEKLGLKYSYEQLAGMIDVAVVEDTRILEISAASTDPEEAMEIANQTAESAKVKIPEVLKAPSPSIVEKAVTPTHSGAGSTSKKVLLFAFVPLVLVLIALTVIFVMDDTIRSPEDVEKAFDVTPLAVIPEGRIESMADAGNVRSGPSGSYSTNESA